MLAREREREGWKQEKREEGMEKTETETKRASDGERKTNAHWAQGCGLVSTVALCRPSFGTDPTGVRASPSNAERINWRTLTFPH